MYGGDERSVYECTCGKLTAEGGFVWSMTLALTLLKNPSGSVARRDLIPALFG
jgi:hypothetical protein